MHQGITPTITLTLPETIDLTYANNVYVTFVCGNKKLQKTGSDLAIDGNEIEVTLTQEETLAMKTVYVQVNWTYLEGGATKRAASDIVCVNFKRTLEPEVLA